MSLSMRLCILICIACLAVLAVHWLNPLVQERDHPQPNPTVTSSSTP